MSEVADDRIFRKDEIERDERESYDAIDHRLCRPLHRRLQIRHYNRYRSIKQGSLTTDDGSVGA